MMWTGLLPSHVQFHGAVLCHLSLAHDRGCQPAFARFLHTARMGSLATA
jgi:hypothetical protein